MSDTVEQLANLFVVVICAFLIILIIGIVFWARSHIGEVQTRGSAIAIADKIMHASCLNATDTAGKGVPFFFEKSSLDKYNNTMLPLNCIDVLGSMYFVQVRTASDTWTFPSDSMSSYVYNALARGLTRECTKNFPFTSAASMKFNHPNPFDYDSNYAGILKYSATVRDGMDIFAARVLIIVDPDSGTDYYPGGFSLCMTDVMCPATAQSKCLCLVGDNKGKCVAVGSICASGPEISCK